MSARLHGKLELVHRDLRAVLRARALGQHAEARRLLDLLERRGPLLRATEPGP